MNGIKVIGFDADDTLWINEPYYREAENRFIQILSDYQLKADISSELFRTEMANLELYGYGIKAFMLSLVECAIELTGKRVSASSVEEIIGLGKSMLKRPIELLEGVNQVLEGLSPHYRLIVATKGDLLDQERKMKRSGIAAYFHHIEVMSDKTEDQYLQLLRHLDVEASEFLMIGNSMKSDIMPPLALGSWGIYIPFHTTWAHEEMDEEPDSEKYFHIDRLTEVLDLVHLPRQVKT